MSNDSTSLAAIPQGPQPPNTQLMQPMRTSELLIAIAVIAAVGLMLNARFLLGRIRQRRKDRGRIKPRRVDERMAKRKVPAQRRNLRLVTPKKR